MVLVHHGHHIKDHIAICVDSSYDLIYLMRIHSRSISNPHVLHKSRFKCDSMHVFIQIWDECCEFFYAEHMHSYTDSRDVKHPMTLRIVFVRLQARTALKFP